MLIIPAFWEAELGRSPVIRSSRPAWPTWRNPVSTNKTKTKKITTKICLRLNVLVVLEHKWHLKSWMPLSLQTHLLLLSYLLTSDTQTAYQTSSHYQNTYCRALPYFSACTHAVPSAQKLLYLLSILSKACFSMPNTNVTGTLKLLQPLLAPFQKM